MKIQNICGNYESAAIVFSPREFFSIFCPVNLEEDNNPPQEAPFSDAPSPSLFPIESKTESIREGSAVSQENSERRTENTTQRNNTQFTRNNKPRTSEQSQSEQKIRMPQDTLNETTGTTTPETETRSANAEDTQRQRFGKDRRRERPFDDRRQQQQQRPQRKDQRDQREARDTREPREPREQKDSREDAQSVSIVIPLYNEEESLRELSQKLRETLSRYNRYEIIFVDDGSTDDSASVIRQLRTRDHHIKYIRFRRNYGKSAALSVGFQHAKGDVIITMDSDLQDEPSEIPKLLAKMKEGYDMVSGWKKKRYDPVSKTIPSRFFNFITSLMSGVHLHDFNCGLKAYKQEVAKSLEIYGELHRYIPVLAFRNGYKVTEEIVVHRPRKFGKSKFGASRFWRGFFDLLTVLFTTRYFRRPLHFFGGIGAVTTSVGFLINAKLTYDWFFHNETLSNRPLLFVGMLLMIVGVQLFSTGLIGDMISKTHSTTVQEYAIREKHL